MVWYTAVDERAVSVIVACRSEFPLLWSVEMMVYDGCFVELCCSDVGMHYNIVVMLECITLSVYHSRVCPAEIICERYRSS